MSNHKLDIFELLRASDKRDFEWFSRQPEDAQKDFKPPVVLRWASTVPDGAEAAYKLWIVNERVNPHLYDLYKHPDLIYRLLASCGLGSTPRHSWIKGATRKAESDAAYNLLSASFPEASDAEIKMLLNGFDRDGFIDFIDECGVQEKEAKNVRAAYDKLFPDQAEKAKGRKK